ncbi:MAG TPA: TlpA disulfide reductase family protein [Polyangia bacterium]|nr:TlpA disulfide reductase family protein [Polyangia bacterium]
MRVRDSVLILLPCLASLSCAGQVRSTPAPVARAAPGGGADFRDVLLGDLTGRPQRFGDALGRRPALVSFWAPWCESCVREAPALQRLSRQAGACGAAVLGVAVGENRQSVERFTHDRRIDFQQLTDPDFHLADALGQRRIPATLVLDAQQAIVYTGEALDLAAIGALKRAIASARPTVTAGAAAPAAAAPAGECPLR